MNFFRLRLINTLLLFAAGVILGLILKDKFMPSAREAAPAPYKPLYAAPAPAAQPAQDDEELTDEPYLAPDEEGRQADKTGPRPAEPENGAQAVIETAGEKPAVPAKGVLKGEEDSFFAKPAQYEGRDLEMDLQMITAKRTGQAWRLNLVYSGTAKKMDYLYVDDADLLGDKPDLRIGYVYKVRFACGKGKTEAGNTLISLAPTGGKADWATGLSAVE